MSDDWTIDVGNWCRKADQNVEDVIHEVFTLLVIKLIDRTPRGLPALWRRPAPAGYRPGLLRAGWAYTTDAPTLAVPTVPDVTGQATKAAIIAALPEVMGGKVHYLSNAVPYSRVIEYQAHSKQAPAGMLRITAAEFAFTVNLVAERVAARK